MKNVDTDPIDEHNRKLENYLSEIGVLPEVTNNLPEPTTIEITPSLNIGEEPIISVIDDII